jgi:hypothetical protein
MKPISEPHGLCSVDPITLLTVGLGAAAGMAGSAMSGSSASAPAATPAAPPAMAAAPPAQNPMGQAKKPGSTPQQSFIGAAATPNTQSGSKTLLGQ